MGVLSVNDITVPDLLDKLRKREWLVPGFQRDFVWSQAEIIALATSIFEKRPIGMATLWEQSAEPDQDLDLAPVSIPDLDKESGKPSISAFATGTANPTKFYAILDGRQRCTAVAIAFGGLRAQDVRFRHAARYYLDLKATDPSKRVVALKETDVQKNKYTADAKCISDGLFPLASNIQGEAIMAQWLRYVQAIREPSMYPNGEMPAENELGRRNALLMKAFQGLMETKLAVYTVPDEYNLADICEIFETLNTTGTKVSTVDLIHSSLYSDTKIEGADAIRLRDWIASIAQQDGAIGWASPSDRPELITQIVTACYVALQTKPLGKRIAGNSAGTISSVKAADLLSTPTLHWRFVIKNSDALAGFLGDFQSLVAGGAFPYNDCPYPASASIYVALRWHLKFDVDVDHKWNVADLDAVFKAFFWRNSLSNRYDQGFLSQIGTDIKEIKSWLNLKASFPTTNKWAQAIQQQMDSYMAKTMLTRDQLVEVLTDGRQTGALQKALTLPMVAGSKQDLLDPGVPLAYPKTIVEMHHIFPKAFCANIKISDLEELDQDLVGRDFVDSTANLMPLSRASNNAWKMKVPEQALAAYHVEFEHVKAILKPMFIDEYGFDCLRAGISALGKFWSHRASLMADDLLSRTKISL
jgi:hypothetical protein